MKHHHHLTFIELLNNNFGVIGTLIGLVLAIFGLGLVLLTVYYASKPAILKYQTVKNRQKYKLAAHRGKIVTELYNGALPTKERIIELLVFLPDQSVRKMLNKEEWVSEAVLQIRKEMLGKTKLSVEEIVIFFNLK